MKRFLPDSIIGWTIVVLLAVLSVSQLVTLSLVHGMRSDTVEVVDHLHLAERIADIVRLMDATPATQRSVLLQRLASNTLQVSNDLTSALDVDADQSWREVLFEEVIGAALWQAPSREHHVALRRQNGALADPIEDTRRNLDLSTDTGRLIHRALTRRQQGPTLLAAIALSDGSWLNFRVPIADPAAGPHWRRILAIACSGLIILTLSVWAVRELTRPLTVLGSAADQLGRNVNAPPLPEKGSREMRQATRAFNTMQARVRSFVADRMQMIAAISHDLRSPITRLRLRAEFIDDDVVRGKMLQDLADMEAMIGTTLSFAREETNPEPRLRVDLVSLLESVCDDLRDVTLTVAPDVPQRLLLDCQALAIRRCVGNLVDNAIKYGEQALVTLSAAPAYIDITIDDHGPGIETADCERVFEPFQRLDGSRNRQTGGVGLGLTIARTVARSHGGDVTLSNRAEGGLRVTLRLPMSVRAALTGSVV
ncbi:MAG: ATP-binding protein [Steroidobacteraceae bacterium]